jgi:hypothetical protein
MNNQFPHFGEGILLYDPDRKGMKANTKNWLIVQVDNQIVSYYRWWLKFEKHIVTNPPSWGAHISVVRGENIPVDSRQKWKYNHGKRVRFQYQHISDVRTQVADDGGMFYFVDVISPELTEIREALGLRTFYKFHITVGRTYG